MFSGLLLIKYEGLNFSRFLDFCIKHNVELKDIEVKEYDKIFFKVSSRDYKHTLLKVKNKWYNISVVKYYGISKFKHVFLRRIGLFIGFACVIITTIIFSKTTFNYNITGLETIEKQEIVDVVEEFGVVLGKINDFDNAELENYLSQQIPKISLVSVMKKGNTLCINIKEKFNSQENVLEAITAPYTMLVNEINVISGTLLVKEGDVVMKGKTLVAPYTVLSDGTKAPCKAVAIIKGDIWFCGNVDFKLKDNILVRTGKKVVVSELTFANKSLLKQNKNVGFELYEVEKTKTYVKNFFLPFGFNKTIYYECEYREVVNTLDENKERLLAESMDIAKNSVPTGYEIVEENQNIIKVDDNLYKIQTYLKSTLEINNAN